MLENIGVFMRLDGVESGFTGAVKSNEPFIKINTDGGVTQLAPDSKYMQPLALHTKIGGPVHMLTQNLKDKGAVDLGPRRAKVNYTGAGGGFKANEWHSLTGSWPTDKGIRPVIDTSRGHPSYVSALKNDFDQNALGVVASAAVDVPLWMAGVGVAGVMKLLGPYEKAQKYAAMSKTRLDHTGAHYEMAVAKVTNTPPTQVNLMAKYFAENGPGRVHLENHLSARLSHSKRLQEKIDNEIKRMAVHSQMARSYFQAADRVAIRADAAVRSLPTASNRAQLNVVVKSALTQTRNTNPSAQLDHLLSVLKSRKSSLDAGQHAFVDQLSGLISEAQNADKFNFDRDSGAGQVATRSRSAQNSVLGILAALDDANVSDARLSSQLTGLGQSYRSESQRAQSVLLQNEIRLEKLQTRERRIQRIRQELHTVIAALANLPTSGRR